MCGRVHCKVDPKVLMRLFGVNKIKGLKQWRNRYNMGPMKYLPVAFMKSSSQGKEETKDAFMPDLDDSDEEPKEAQS